jgi:hypothetical protein
LLVVGCDEPETVVTNYVHTDGSVTRKIEMRNYKNKFEIKDLQIPFDSSWTLTDSIELNEKGDTIWVRNVEKEFENVEEINKTYKLDSGANKNISRKVVFNKKFRWFNTIFRFSEQVEKKLANGYVIQDFLNEEELVNFYSPESLKKQNENGPDSLKFRALRDSVEVKTEKWLVRNLISEWINEFNKLTEGKENGEMYRTLKAREIEIVNMAELNSAVFDSLWENDYFLNHFLGEENAAKYKIEADSAETLLIDNFLTEFNEYSVRTVMPGKLTGTNGFADSSKVLLWPVNSDFFLSQSYEMWAESKVSNIWAWVISGLFLLFVLTGIIFRIIKKG